MVPQETRWLRLRAKWSGPRNPMRRIEPPTHAIIPVVSFFSMRLRIAISMLMLLALTAFISAQSPSTQKSQAFDSMAFYKNNCVGCHGSKAQKNFNPDLPEGQMVDSILNGVPMETPPDMPAFAEKGINEERAKALIAYMKSIRQ